MKGCARYVIMAGIIAAACSIAAPVARADVDPALKQRFETLSTQGNSTCSRAFAESIPKMPANAGLRGSCRSPMDLKRYGGQIEGPKKYTKVEEVPPDPYDIQAGLAQKLLEYDEIVLTPAQQAAYDYAMQHSEEHGPCCCHCWRWHVYGGLA